jgi:hypothetical protein
LWQLGTLVGAPVGIAVIACISIPAMIIGIPSWVGRKIHDHYKTANRHKRNLAVVGGVVTSLTLSPALVSSKTLKPFKDKAKNIDIRTTTIKVTFLTGLTLRLPRNEFVFVLVQ